MDQSDEELMMDYVKNDSPLSFELLYHRYAGKVFGYVMNQVRDRQQCEEIHQNIFLKFHQSRAQYRPEHPFAPWFFTIVRSVMLDSIRNRNRNQRRIYDMEQTEWENIPDPATATSSSNLNEAPDLDSLKKRLNKIEKREIEMRYEKGFSFEQIARELGVTEVGVRKRISRALQKMRRSK